MKVYVVVPVEIESKDDDKFPLKYIDITNLKDSIVSFLVDTLANSNRAGFDYGNQVNLHFDLELTRIIGSQLEI